MRLPHACHGGAVWPPPLSQCAPFRATLSQPRVNVSDLAPLLYPVLSALSLQLPVPCPGVARGPLLLSRPRPLLALFDPSRIPELDLDICSRAFIQVVNKRFNEAKKGVGRAILMREENCEKAQSGASLPQCTHCHCPHPAYKSLSACSKRRPSSSPPEPPMGRYGVCAPFFWRR